MRGIGYVFAADDPYTFIDLDHCYEDLSGYLDGVSVGKGEKLAAQRIVDDLDSWTETSAGREGVHIVVRSSLDGLTGHKKHDVELYDRDRFMAITGDVIRQRPIREAQGAVTTLHRSVFGERDDAELPALKPPRTWTPEELACEVADIPNRAAEDSDFLKLWNGDMTEYDNDHSSADLALCGQLAYYCRRDPVLIEAAFSASALGRRDKWTKRKDYRERTIAKALADGGPTWISEAEVCAMFDDHTAEPAKPSLLLLGPHGSRFNLDDFIARPPEPKIIVDQYMLEDAGGLVAPGGTGKTTLALFEAVHIALGRSLYGRWVIKPGAALIVSAEDDRATILYRLHHICQQMDLSPEEYQRVAASVYVEDLSAINARLLTMRDGVLRPTALLQELIDLYHPAGLSYVHLDPVSLIGPGEESGNDGMAELMRTARRLSRELGAGVRLVHHVAKAVGREGILDQYAGRGGGAFADNARFIHQLVTVNDPEFTLHGRKYEVGIPETDIAEGNVLALMTHKLSYQQREPHPVFLKRDGFVFQHRHGVVASADAHMTLDARMERARGVVKYVLRRRGEGMALSRRDLDAADHLKALSMKREDVRSAVNLAIDTGLLEEAELPATDGRRGAPKTELRAGSGLLNPSPEGAK
jgi:RecA-family ATPase